MPVSPLGLPLPSGTVLPTLPGLSEVEAAVRRALTLRSRVSSVLGGSAADAGTAAAVLPPRQRLPYVQLGSLDYPLVGPLVGMEASREHVFAEHPTVEGVSRLQYTGRKPEQLSLELQLHTDYCDPSTELAALRLAEAAAAPLPLVWASGELRGRYVIAGVVESIERTDALGAPSLVTVRLTLREWVEDQLLVVTDRPSSVTAKRSAKVKAAAPAVKSHGASRSWGDEPIVRIPPAAAADATAVRPRAVPAGNYRDVPVRVITRQQAGN